MISVIVGRVLRIGGVCEGNRRAGGDPTDATAAPHLTGPDPHASAPRTTPCYNTHRGSGSKISGASAPARPIKPYVSRFDSSTPG